MFKLINGHLHGMHDFPSCTSFPLAVEEKNTALLLPFPALFYNIALFFLPHTGRRSKNHAHSEIPPFHALFFNHDFPLLYVVIKILFTFS